jgi:hypothetical protein
MITQGDIKALREYVRAPGNNGQNQAESTVRLHVSHSNLRQEFMDLRLEKHVSVLDTPDFRVVGTPIATSRYLNITYYRNVFH